MQSGASLGRSQDSMAFDVMVYVSACMALTTVPFQSYHVSTALRDAPLCGSSSRSTCWTPLTVPQDPQESAVFSRMGVQQHSATWALYDVKLSAETPVANDGLACDVMLGSFAVAEVASYTFTAFNRTWSSAGAVMPVASCGIPAPAMAAQQLEKLVQACQDHPTKTSIELNALDYTTTAYIFTAFNQQPLCRTAQLSGPPPCRTAQLSGPPSRVPILPAKVLTPGEKVVAFPPSIAGEEGLPAIKEVYAQYERAPMEERRPVAAR